MNGGHLGAIFTSIILPILVEIKGVRDALRYRASLVLKQMVKMCAITGAVAVQVGGSSLRDKVIYTMLSYVESAASERRARAARQDMA